MLKYQISLVFTKIHDPGSLLHCNKDRRLLLEHTGAGAPSRRIACIKVQDYAFKNSNLWSSGSVPTQHLMALSKSPTCHSSQSLERLKFA